MKIDVRQLERPVRDATDRPDDGEEKMSPESRELILWYGDTEAFRPDDSEGHLHLVEDEGRDTSVSE